MARIFRNRHQAGTELARELVGLGLHEPLILAIPRGGVVIGFEVAAVLGGDLDIVVARKLGAPGQPELAIGAVMHDGSVFLKGEIVRSLRVSDAYIEEEKSLQMTEASRRLRVYRGDRPYPRITGREAVVVDDGVATGATIMAATRWAKAQGCKRVAIGSPVAPRDTAAQLGKEADDVVFCTVPEPFFAIGQFYEEFEQLTDDEVIALLRRSWGERG